MKILATDVAGELAQRHWQVQGQVEVLPSYADQNFRIRSSQGEFVLKLACPGWSYSDLDLENQAMLLLGRAEPGIDWPRVQAAVDGSHLLALCVAGEQRLVRLLSFVPGTTYAAAIGQVSGAERRALQFSLGRVVACLNRGLSTLVHPAAARQQDWNLLNLPQLLDEIAYIDDTALRCIVEQHTTSFCANLDAFRQRLPWGVLHHDANDLNVIVRRNDEGKAAVSSVIDFGDMCTGLRLAELAVACTYAMQHEAEPAACAQQILQGYLSESPLSDEEQELLPSFILARLCHSILMATRTFRHHPENPYVLISQAGVRGLLHVLHRQPQWLQIARIKECSV
ncbi:MAG: phosphotransferase [Rhodanobacteraceae bacterium]|nr:phosphotransferase [Rhodanobacteraceae bacterium]